MKLLVEIDVFAAMFHRNKSRDLPGKDVAEILRKLAIQVEGMNLEELQEFDQDLFVDGKNRVGNAVIDN